VFDHEAGEVCTREGVIRIASGVANTETTKARESSGWSTQGSLNEQHVRHKMNALADMPHPHLLVAVYDEH